MTKCDKSSDSGDTGGGGLAITGITHCGVVGSFLKTTAGAFALALLLAGPASAAQIESPLDAAPGDIPPAPPGAAAANARADLDGDRIEDALGARIAVSRAGERFDVIVVFEGPGAVGRGRAAAGPFAVTREFSIINGFQAQLTGPQISGLSRAPGLFRISGNGEVTAHDIPSNDDMGATDARIDFNFDGSGVTICVIDTGIDIPHELFVTKGMDSTRFFDAIGGLADPYDDNGHGSHVSGIAAGNGTTSLAVEAIGVAPGANLKVAKVLDGNGSGNDATVLAGIDWCANQPDTDILSMSLGGGPTDGTDPMSVAVNCVADPDYTTEIDGTSLCGGLNDPKIIVVSAGNSGAMWSTIGTPGVAENAITVGSIAEWSGDPSTNWQDDGIYLNSFSSRGPVVDGNENFIRIKPDIVGPGSRVLSAYVFDQNKANEFGIASGTSMSAPFVTGVIALMLQADPTLGVIDPLDSEQLLPHEKVRAILAATAVDRGAPGKDNEYGHGVIDAYAAVAMADPATTSYVPTAYPGYTRLANQTVADVANPPAFPSDDFASWTWEFTATDSITPIAATMIVHETNHADVRCTFFFFGQCMGWTVVSPDLEIKLEQWDGINDKSLNSSWSMVPAVARNVTFSECPARPVNDCGPVGRAEGVHFIPTAGETYRFRVFPTNDGTTLLVGGGFDFEISMGAPVSGLDASFTFDCTDLACTFADTSSDPDGSVVSWLWDFGGAGVPDLTDPQNPSFTYAAGGPYTVTLTVTDNEGNEDSQAAQVTVIDPDANLLPVADFSFTTSDLTANFTDSSTDSDGTVKSWDWDFGDVVGGTSTQRNPSYPYAEAGSYSVTLTVTDNIGDSGSLIKQVTVTAPNEPPAASFVVDTHTVEGDPVCGALLGNKCQFTDTSTDPNDVTDIVSWDWDFGGATSIVGFPVGSGEKWIVEFPSDGPDPVTATLTVTDSAGATGFASMTLPLSAPTFSAPTASISAPADGSTHDAGVSITFTGSASDPKDGDLTSSLAWTADGTSIGTGASASTSLSVGTHTITASVTDTDGLIGDASITVTVNDVPATVHIADLDDESVLAARGRWDAVVSIMVRDDNGAPVSGAAVAGNWGNGASGSNSCTTDGSGQCTITKTRLKGNASPVTFSVSGIDSADLTYASGDNADPEADSNGTLIMLAKPEPAVNQPPVATISAPADGSNFIDGETIAITFTGSANDPEDLDLTSSLSWASDGVGIGSGASVSTILSAGAHTITASVSDGGGLNGTDTISITVGPLPNLPPVASFTVSQNPCLNMTCLLFNTTTDPNGITDIESWHWDYGEGGPASTDEWAPGVGGLVQYAEEGPYTITLTATDSQNVVSTSTVVQVYLTAPSNTLPSATITAPADGSTHDEGASISFTGTASDPEDGNLTASLSWTSDGVNIGSGPSFSVSNLSVGPHTITASVTDSGDLSGQDTISITVVPLPPSAITLSANGFKVKGKHWATLTWSGAATTNVEIHRDGVIVETVAKTASPFDHNIGFKGGATYVFEICETGGGACSATVNVVF